MTTANQGSASAGCRSAITYNSGTPTVCVYPDGHDGPHFGGGQGWTFGGSQAGRRNDLVGRPGKAAVASGGDRDATAATCEEVDGCCFTHGPCFRTQHDPAGRALSGLAVPLMTTQGTSDRCTHGMPLGFCAQCHQWATPPARPMQQGWQCPGCGGCYAPWAYSCTHCKPKVKPATGANEGSAL